MRKFATLVALYMGGASANHTGATEDPADEFKPGIRVCMVDSLDESFILGIKQSATKVKLVASGVSYGDDTTSGATDTSFYPTIDSIVQWDMPIIETQKTIRGEDENGDKMIGRKFRMKGFVNPVFSTSADEAVLGIHDTRYGYDLGCDFEFELF